ncbi:hypothetical protein, partial [Arthrobacter globiformis]|uniref:hypothetical protein n=1 Tax=Arthrobacter globiformis TaxID=1665 RepID=UPI001FE04EA8
VCLFVGFIHPELVASASSGRRRFCVRRCFGVSFWGGIFMSRVLSTEQAKAAIGQVQSIINGGFTDQISALDAQGRVLSDPNVWDGPLAAQFRGSTWPETKAALDKAKEELEQLRGQLQKISQDIFSAGGGA